MDTAGFITLDHAVSSYIIKKGEDDRQYERYMQFAIEAVTEINIGVLKNVRAVKLDVAENNTVDLPYDYIDYNAIAVEYDGRLVGLSRNENIALPLDYECGVASRNTTSTSSNGNSQKRASYSFVPFFYSGEYYTTYTASGGFNKAYFRIDEANRRIVLLSDTFMEGAQIIMEYKSSGVSSDTIVPRDTLATIETYIDWQSIKFDRRIPAGERQLAQRAYRNERRKLRARKYSFTAQEWADLVNGGLTQGVKR